MIGCFLPAIGPYITEEFQDRKTYTPWRRPIHFLNPVYTSIYYPYALASFALWRDAELPVRGSDFTLFSDSGGYTQVTQPGYSASPTDVMRWQIKNSQRGVIFDIPPYRPGSAIQFRGSASQWWDESIRLTTQNVRRAFPIYEEYRLRNGGPFRWWGVVQGEERSQMEDWHGKISEVYPFHQEGEGWALAPKPSTDLLSCTRYMRFAHDRGLKNVHLLQVTADRVVALLLSLGEMSGKFDLITYDSASALRCAINRSAIISDGAWGQLYIKESRTVQVDERCVKCHKIGTECRCPGNENDVHLMMMECSCQSCVWYREMYPLTNSEYPHSVFLHNHIIMVESFKQMSVLAKQDPDKLLRWATGNAYGDILREWDGQSQSKSQSRPMSLMDRL